MYNGIMDNINIEHLRAVATQQEIGEAFGVSHVAVGKWEKRGDIPDQQRYRYAAGKLPDGKKKALALYKRALKHLREQNGNL